LRIEFPFCLSELDKLFEVSDFLDNRDELVAKFTPAVTNYLSYRERLKPGLQQQAHKLAFPDFIITLIKRELLDHFNLTPEEVLLLTDRELLDMLTESHFFKEENYLKE
jgi:hypothetical protein